MDDKSSYPVRSIDSDRAVGLVGLAERARKTIEDAVPKNTRRAYEGDLRRFAAWCTTHGLVAMPASDATLCLYLRYLADTPPERPSRRRGKFAPLHSEGEQTHRISTVERALAAICTAHVRAGHASPWTHTAVHDMRAALRKEKGVRPSKKKAADDEVLRRLLGVMPDNLIGLRDRAMLTIGWCAALRESEIVQLEVRDITRVTKGMIVLVRSSKTDQEARGDEIPVFFSNKPEHCPVRCLDAWVSGSGITNGSIFRQLGRRLKLGGPLNAEAVCQRVKRYAKLAGFSFDDFGGHSLRRGFITAAARRGKDLDAIAVVSRHKSMKTLRGYIHRETLHERGAGEGLL